MVPRCDALCGGRGPWTVRPARKLIRGAGRIANEDAPRPRSAGGLGPAIEALLRRDPSARPDASSARRLLAAAVTPPAHNRPGGGKYREDREDPFQGNVYRSEGSRADGHKGDANPRGGYRRNGGPPARPAGPAGTAALPVSSTFLPEGSPPGSRPTAPQPPAAELPSWMIFPPEESPPEGMRPPAAKGGSAPNDPPPGAAAPSPANLVRAAGLPAGSDTPAGTGLPGAGITFPRPAGHPAWHPAGRHGAQAAGRQRWLLAGLGAVAVVCAGVAGGLAIGHSGRSSLPSGYHWYTAPAARTSTTAGFTMAVPNGWRASTRGLITNVVDPVGHVSMQVDLTPFGAATAPGEASMLEEQARTDGSLPGYRRVALRPLLFHGGLGAAWEYTWQEPGIGRVDVLDVLFTERGRAGRQAYQIRVSTPMAGRTASRAIFDEALRTFGPR